MIPTYPKFAKLTIAHKKEFEAYTHKFEPYAEFSFSTLFCWDADDHSEVSMLNGNLVIQMPDYLTDEPLYSVLGTNKVDETIATLLKDFKKLNFVPQVTIDHITNKSQFKIKEDRDLFDYIYPAEQQVNLPGKHFKGRRNKSGHLVRLYEDKIGLKKISFSNPKDRADVIEVFDTWCKDKGRTKVETRHEKEAIVKLMKYSDHFNFIGLMVMVDDKYVGFSINHVLQKKFGVCIFQKTTRSLKHIDVFLTKMVAIELMHQGCDYISWEADVGLEGLREFKVSYRPSRFLVKYIITSS